MSNSSVYDPDTGQGVGEEHDLIVHGQGNSTSHTFIHTLQAFAVPCR